MPPFAQLAQPARALQSYLSRSPDPFLNLAIEDHILRASPPAATVLFIYTNRPCIVLGRNQNPWAEANLAVLRDVALVRRRSGGGAVFHDHGNVNWSITGPRASFARDTHAEMVVRALRRLGIARARVNGRHDIVLDQGRHPRDTDPHDTHRSPFTLPDGALPAPLKVSGSAYKLTRARALHHATTLLASPNLALIPRYLRSPAKPFVHARGVESVSSPVANIGLDPAVFQAGLQDEFATSYASAHVPRPEVEMVGEELLDIPAVRKGYNELQTEDWIWGQTPQFTVTLPAERSGLHMDVHHGVIKSVHTKGTVISAKTLESLRSALLEQRVYRIRDWDSFLRCRIGQWNQECSLIADNLNYVMPSPELPKP